MRIHRSTDKPCIIKYYIEATYRENQTMLNLAKRVTKSKYLAKSLDYAKPLFRPKINTNLEFKSL